MKTVQQYFRECNVEELISLYNNLYPISASLGYTSTCSELINDRNIKLLNLIDKIQTTELTSIEDEYILFAYFIPDNDFLATEVACVKQSELHDDIVLTYSYSLSHISETAGFYIADLDITQSVLDEVLASYLYESTFFGYEQEGIDETLDHLEASSKELDKLLNSESNIISTELMNSDTTLPQIPSVIEKEYDSKRFKDYKDAYYKYCELSFDTEINKLTSCLETSSK